MMLNLIKIKFFGGEGGRKFGVEASLLSPQLDEMLPIWETLYFHVYIMMNKLSIAWTYCYRSHSNAFIVCCTESVARDLQFVQHIHCAQYHFTAELTSSFRAQ